MLSLVQSKEGSYEIRIDDSAVYNTGECGFFIAPSIAMQKITHHNNPHSNRFTMRFVFLDVLINKKYHIDDLFDLPVVPDKIAAQKFDEDFDIYDGTDNICDRMSCLYRITKHLLEISSEKKALRNAELYPLIEYISQNYMKNISVHDMANIMNMSESNLYAVFKKITGTTPVQYLNNYRLSAASERLINSNDSIRNISESVGIADQFYFSKMFKKKYSLSPQMYRQSTKNFF